LLDAALSSSTSVWLASVIVKLVVRHGVVFPEFILLFEEILFIAPLVLVFNLRISDVLINN